MAVCQVPTADWTAATVPAVGTSTMCEAYSCVANPDVIFAGFDPQN